uniref:Si:ch211-189a15.5 n=1 Tax=Scleropages formosus TaxID=113540 RepID=A0A8C9V687_SCLFO
AAGGVCQDPPPLADLYRDYVSHCEQAWPSGTGALCDDSSPLGESARRLVRSRGCGAARSAAAFDVCTTAAERVRASELDGREVLRALGRAAELLETYSLNAALFPWRKEMRSLKTFTGPFVYCVQSALPDHIARKVLESIGYRRETDTEYRLSENVGPDRPMQVAFDLFLARQECEYLLEVLGDRTRAECIHFLQTRSLDTDGQGCMSKSAGDTSGEGGSSLQADVSEHPRQDADEACPLVDPGSLLRDRCEFVADSADNAEQRSLEMPPLRELSPQAMSQPYTFLRDKSILEMQENYPDLAIRQKPVFSKPQSLVTASGRPLEARMPEVGPVALVSPGDMSGPQSMAVLRPLVAPASSTALPQLYTHRDARAMGEGDALSEKQVSGDDLRVAQLSKQLDKLHIKEPCGDDNLKYPIEETALLDALCHDTDFALLSSPRSRTQVLICSPPGSDRASSSGHNTIKEPPQSFYIPPSPLGTHCGTEPCVDPASLCSRCQHACRGSCQRPEDDILQTYVLVEREKKDVRPDGGF